MTGGRLPLERGSGRIGQDRLSPRRRSIDPPAIDPHSTPYTTVVPAGATLPLRPPACVANGWPHCTELQVRCSWGDFAEAVKGAGISPGLVAGEGAQRLLKRGQRPRGTSGAL